LVTVKGISTATATANPVSASVSPTVTVTVKNGLASSTDFASGDVGIVAINSANTAAFFATGTLSSGVASIQFADKFPKGTYTVWIRYSGSETNIPATIKKTLVVN
jgi:hypothetical protein